MTDKRYYWCEHHRTWQTGRCPASADGSMAACTRCRPMYPGGELPPEEKQKVRTRERRALRVEVLKNELRSLEKALAVLEAYEIGDIWPSDGGPSILPAEDLLNHRRFEIKDWLRILED